MTPANCIICGEPSTYFYCEKHIITGEETKVTTTIRKVTRMISLPEHTYHALLNVKDCAQNILDDNCGLVTKRDLQHALDTYKSINGRFNPDEHKV